MAWQMIQQFETLIELYLISILTKQTRKQTNLTRQMNLTATNMSSRWEGL
jgi:hypothetical protein